MIFNLLIIIWRLQLSGESKYEQQNYFFKTEMLVWLIIMVMAVATFRKTATVKDKIK
jgi:dolichyl-phosphate-mannose--protein O-mannosyl transferase